jgi:hypothetical protein
MRNLILPMGLLTVVGVTVSVACSSSTPSVPGPFATWPAGSVPDSCTDGDAILVHADECGCGGSTSYAICSGGTYSECDCSLPTGDTVVPFGGNGDGGADANAPADSAPDVAALDEPGPDTSTTSDSGTDATSSGDTSADTSSASDTGSGDAADAH